MDALITVNQRGAFTLPKEAREQAGIGKGGTIRVQVTNEGILLTPVVAYPVEIYTPERIAEFRLNNAIDHEDYQDALQEVREMGLDPKVIPHKPIKGAR